jgi:2-C-methyl-D-erythritol 4-phosphate cytidylyltransferase
VVNEDSPHSTGGIALVLAAAGTGSRFGGGAPKQFLDYRGRRLYLSALEPFFGLVQEVVLVVPDGWVEPVRLEVRSIAAARITVVAGGESRQESVELGLGAVSAGIEHVLVHDAARPFVSPELIGRVIRGTNHYGACIPGLAPPDTVKVVEGSRVLRTLPREGIRLAQTPQGFEIGLLARALARARAEEFNGTDEASLVERLNVPVHVVEGDPENIKVTWRHDLEGDRRDRSGKEKL